MSVCAPWLQQWSRRCHCLQGLYYSRSQQDPRTKVVQQLRELEGRERLEKGRLERRMKLTALGAGEGMCKARSQRRCFAAMAADADQQRGEFCIEDLHPAAALKLKAIFLTS